MSRDHSTIETSRSRAQREVEALERKFGQQYGALPAREEEPRGEIPRHQPWNTHCPGSIALTFFKFGGYVPGYRGHEPG